MLSYQSYPLPPPFPFAFSLPEHQGLFQWVSSSYQVAKGLGLQLHITPSNEHSNELISFRTEWFGLFVVSQGETLKSFLQGHNSKELIMQHSAFFMVQLLHLHMTTAKTIALTFVSKVMPLLFDKLSRFVIAFLPRSNVTWPRGLKIAGEIKVANQLILKLGEGAYPGLSRWVHCNQKDP